MKNTLIISILISFSLLTKTFAAPALNLDVADQNFNSTDKIVIDQDEIKKSRASSLPTLLSTKANISISTNNVQPNSIYIRGGDSSHVLILVDGVPTYDSSSPQRTLNLFNLNLSKIKRIEILKGSQSVLYGGQAMSGVIKIETFSNNAENKTSLIADAAATRAQGSKQSLSLDTLQTVSDNVDISASVYGFNARNNSPVKDSEELYPQKSGVVDIAVRVRSELENIIKGSYSKDDNNITNATAATSKPYDTVDYKATVETSTLSWILKKPDSFTLTSSIVKVDRNFFQAAENNLAPFPFNGTVDQDFEGILTNIRLDANLYKTDTASLNAGAQLNTEQMDIKYSGVQSAKNDTQYEGMYLKSDYKLPENFFFEYGVRQENTRTRPMATSYHAGLVWNDLIKLEYSTGFKSPSLFQLYAPSYGNPALLPEKSKNYSLSIEHKFSEQFFASLTYFDSQFENFIEYSTPMYQNVSKARTTGVESLTQFNFLENALRVSLSLGYQEPKDLARAPTSSPWLIRRPLRTASIKMASDVSDMLSVGAEAVHTGEKLDKSGTTALVTVEDYTLINLYANYQLATSTTIFGRVDNVENKDYQTTYGFYNQGSIYKLGAQLSF